MENVSTETRHCCTLKCTLKVLIFMNLYARQSDGEFQLLHSVSTTALKRAGVPNCPDTARSG